MPTLKELRAAYEAAGAELRAAEDRLGQARDRALGSVADVARLETMEIEGDHDTDALALARRERTAAMADLKAIGEELSPPSEARDDLTA